MDAAEFYTGIVPEVYSALRGTRFSSDRYRTFIQEHGLPALELGCGEDGPFFELASAGYDVIGVDSSADMVRRGRERLERNQITAEIHHQRMEELNLEATFASIYLAGPTFNLLPDDTTALNSLQAIARHLRPAGAALIPLWMPQPTPPEHMGVTRVSPSAAGEARYTVVDETYDRDRRVRTTHVRYELITEREPLVADRAWVIHWFSDDVFRELATTAGLRAAFTRLDDEQTEAVLRLI
ncbi:MAG TPA: class I SAM-dependent methyltransferase [Candidatus Microbacterium pullistercoris]|nr:class I SAM-dependent methyltransferase [Candidatus Microbacterium pullistercoris]